jgi:DNA replication protein DnaC
MQSIKQILESPETGRDPKANKDLQEALSTAQTPVDSIASRTLSYECQKCSDTGFVEVENKRKPGNTLSARCACILAKIIKTALPARYQDASLSDFRPAVASAVTEWLKEPTDGLLLTGGTGTGKTHLAAALFISQVNARKNIRFRRAAQLFQAIRDSYGQDDVSEEEILRDFIEPKMLILDDLGAGGLTDHERRYTLEVLDRRLNAQQPTIVTMNWTLKQLSERMDERVASRLSEFKLISFEAQEDRRGVRTKGEKS